MKDAPNNSMDVRAKQGLSYRVVLFTLNLSVAVLPHVISAVRHQNQRYVYVWNEEK
jgi:hypothetical protein